MSASAGQIWSGGEREIAKVVCTSEKILATPLQVSIIWRSCAAVYSKDVSTVLKQFDFVSGPFRIQIQAAKRGYEFHEGMWIYNKLSTTKASFISIVIVTIIVIIVILISPYHHHHQHDYLGHDHLKSLSSSSSSSMSSLLIFHVIIIINLTIIVN